MLWPPRNPLLAVALVLSACGQGNNEHLAASGPRFEALQLVADPVRPEDQTIERYLILRPGPKMLFRVKTGTAAVVEIEDAAEGAPQHALDIEGQRGFQIHFPVKLDGYRFNAVALDMDYSDKRDFTLDFISGEERLISMRGKALSTKPRNGSLNGRQVLHFRLPTLYQPRKRITRVDLYCANKITGLRLYSIDFLQAPLNLRLPSPAQGPDLILIDSEVRRGVGLSSEYGVASESEIVADSTLRFSYAAPGVIPGGSLDATDPPALELTVRGTEGLGKVHRFTPQSTRNYAWHSARVDLAKFSGQQITLTWKVHSPTPIPWALAEVGVLSGVGQPRRVVLITSDTHRGDHIGAARSSVGVLTPQLDALADRGVLFENCFVTTNITNPSHIALMTATHPRDTGVFSNNEPISALAPTLAEAFREAGFATFAALSVRHLGNATSGLGQGFDRLTFPRIRSKRDGAEAIADILEWTEEYAELPLFLWVHLYDAHTPYVPPEHLIASYYSKPLAAAFDPSAPPIKSVPARVYNHIFPGLKDLEYPKALYASEVTHVDNRLAQLFEHPALSNAVFAFTSDHGESLGQHGIFYAHSDLYPDSLHVPLIIRYPGCTPGQRVPGPVQQTDLGRTLLDLGGAWAVEFPGKNLFTLAQDAGAQEEARFGIGAGKAMASITLGDWHLILALKDVIGHHRVHMRPRHEVSLFNLARDPLTEHNLLETQLEKASELREQLIQWLARAEDCGWRGVKVTDSETLRSLEALGYAAAGPAGEAEQDTPYFDVTCRCEWCLRF